MHIVPQSEIPAIAHLLGPEKTKKLTNRSDFQHVADLRPGPIDRVRRQFKYACRFQRNLRDAERPKMLFHVNDLSLFVEEDKVDRKEHSDGVHASGRDDPKPP